jgi:hypothetical protein
VGDIIGKLSECPPTVFHLQWPPNITASIITESNLIGTLTNSDLELAGHVILWIMMVHVCTDLVEKRVALFSNNSPSVGWVQRMAVRSSLVAEQLIWVLALCFNLQHVCPITTLQYSVLLIWQQTKVAFQIGGELTNLFQNQLPPPQPELVDYLLAHLRDSYTRDFRLADATFYSGRLEATSHGRKEYWDHWQRYAMPMGVDPYLQDTNFSKRIRLLSGFAARVRTGFYGAGRQVKTCTVSSALTGVGQTIALACNSNPTKIVGSKRLLPCLQIMLDGYRKVGLPTRKKLPLQLDVPELLITTAYQPGMAEVQRATSDLTMIAFYYLLWVGEYAVKGLQNNTKQTVQFKYEDVSFFKKNTQGQLRCLPRNAAADLISTADGATLKLDNKKTN